MDQDSGKEEVVEKDPTQGIELQETQAQRVPQRRRRIHISESELRETNLCVSLWFASLFISLALLCASTSIYLVVFFVCVHGLEIYLISPVKTLHQITFVLESKRGETLILGQVLHRTGLTGLRNRSDWLPLVFCS